MALTWNTTQVKDLQEKYPAVMMTDADGDKTLHEINPVTWALIWSTIFIGIGNITEANHKDFYFRLSLYEKVFGTFLREKRQPHPLTHQEVIDHIGLSTNASWLTHAKFMAMIAENWRWETKTN